MSKISELAEATQHYKDTVNLLEANKPKPKDITLYGDDTLRYGAVEYDPYDNALKIYDCGGYVRFTATEGEKLLAALKELYE
jgi:hypothetical protein